MFHSERNKSKTFLEFQKCPRVSEVTDLIIRLTIIYLYSIVVNFVSNMFLKHVDNGGGGRGSNKVGMD